MSDIEVSVLMPFCNEGPNVVFTTQAIIEELTGFCKFEVILIDNKSHDYIQCETGGRKFPVRSRAYFQSKKGRINTMFFRKGVVKYFQYDDNQSHWLAKNFGIDQSKGKYLFFLDAHCIMKRDSVRKMLQFLRDNEGKTYEHPMAPGKPWRVGAVHAYINYMMDSRSLEYRVQRKTFGYSFATHQVEPYWIGNKGEVIEPSEEIQKTVKAWYWRKALEGTVRRGIETNPVATIGFDREERDVLIETEMSRIIGNSWGKDPLIKPHLHGTQVVIPAEWPKHKLRFPTKPYPVCVASTCAMMTSRSLVEEYNKWHPEFLIYSGGESYMNWMQSTCGYEHWIHPDAWCWHWAEKRGYSSSHHSHVKNGFIAAYVVGGEKYLNEQVEQRCVKDRTDWVKDIAKDIKIKCRAQRRLVASKQLVDFDTFINYWTARQGVWA